MGRSCAAEATAQGWVNAAGAGVKGPQSWGQVRLQSKWWKTHVWGAVCVFGGLVDRKGVTERRERNRKHKGRKNH